ncbi:hypothetical protein CR513_16269, partial [Mucuna pruriens]
MSYLEWRIMKVLINSLDDSKKLSIFESFKDLKKLPMEELLATLKVHEIEVNEDDGQGKDEDRPRSSHVIMRHFFFLKKEWIFLEMMESSSSLDPSSLKASSQDFLTLKALDDDPFLFSLKATKTLN